MGEYTNDPDILRPFAEGSMSSTFSPWAQFIGRLNEDGSVRGCVVYDVMTKFDIQMHWIGTDKRWITKTLAQAAFDYPFRQLGLRRVTGLVDERLVDVIALNKRLGFKVEGTIRKGLGDRDIILMGLLREDCKFHGQ